MRKILVVAGILILGTAVYSQTFELQKTNIGVMRLEARGVNSMLVNLINELMCSTIPQLGDFWVINTDILYDSLKSIPDKSVLNCKRKKCYLEMGDHLQVSYLIVGSIAQQDTVYTLNIINLDVDNDEVFSRVTKTYTGEETGLVEQLEKWMYTLFRIKTEEDKKREAEEAARKAAEDKKEFKMDFIDFSTMYNIIRLSGPDSSELSYGVGYTLNKDISGLDYFYVSLRHENLVFGLDVNWYTKDVDEKYTEYGTEYWAQGTDQLGGGALIIGYQWLDLLDGLITLTPGITGGWYFYKRDMQTKQFNPMDSTWVDAFPTDITRNSCVGPNIRADINYRITRQLKVSAFVFEQWLYLPEILSLLRFGIQGSYCFDLSGMLSGSGKSAPQ